MHTIYNTNQQKSHGDAERAQSGEKRKVETDRARACVALRCVGLCAPSHNKHLCWREKERKKKNTFILGGEKKAKKGTITTSIIRTRTTWIYSYRVSAAVDMYV